MKKAKEGERTRNEQGWGCCRENFVGSVQSKGLEANSWGWLTAPRITGLLVGFEEQSSSRNVMKGTELLHNGSQALEPLVK